MKAININSSEQGVVSILMNCFNGEEFLEEAIESVISQTYSNWEIIFWDNQSTDSSASIVKSFEDDRIKYFLAPNHTSIGKARAEAYQFMKGDYVAVLDVDDLWLPLKLEKQIKKFKDDPNTGIVISDTIFFSNKLEKKIYDGNYPPEGYIFKDLLERYFVSLETILIKKSVIDSLDYAFDSDFSHITDFDLILRVSMISKLAIVKEVLGKWRVHQSGGSWAEHHKFLEEESRWISKMENNPIWTNDDKIHLNLLKMRHSMKKAYEKISNKLYFEARDAVRIYKFKNLSALILFVSTFIPFSSYIYSYHKNKRRNQWF